MSSIRILLFSLFLITSTSFIETYRILGVFPFNGKSHNVVLDAIAQGLAKQGHQVDVITHFPPKNPPANYKVVVDLNGTIEETINNFTVDFAKSLFTELTDYIAGKFGNDLCDLMGLDGIQKIVKNPPKNPPYDVVIVHAYGANCFFGIGHVLQVPVVTVSAAIEFPWTSYFIGNNDNLAVVPNVFFNKYDATSFWDRLKNVYTYYSKIHRFHVLTEKPQTDAMRKYLDPNMPGIREVERSAALNLVNRHPALFGPKPVTSSLIEVSALHIEENPKLPADLKKWLDESASGVVYFTFGSMVVIETLPENTILDIYESFSKIAPVRVLMKIVDKNKLPAGLPDNVLTRPWIPQQAVLNHKSVRVYLTHGGLMSTQEALYYGVPMIGVPLFSDQGRIIRMFVEKNMAIQLNHDNLTSSSLDWALSEILTNTDYKKNAEIQSKLFKDNPMKPIDKAVFWIEYVIRNGAEVLRSPSLDLYWWQLVLLDIYGFVLLCVIFALIVAYYLTKIQIQLLSSTIFKKRKADNRLKERKVRKIKKHLS